MPRHSHPPGQGKRKQGRHKRRESKETLYWEKELLPPPKPHWMPQEAYEKMLKIREGG